MGLKIPTLDENEAGDEIDYTDEVHMAVTVAIIETCCKPREIEPEAWERIAVSMHPDLAGMGEALRQHYEEDLAKRSLVWNDIEKRHVFVKVEEQKDEAEAS